MTDRMRRGLLLYPEFPDSSFWSYRHIMPLIGAKAAFPPLGLLTFAGLMPPEWSFELIDLNVERPPNDVLRARIADRLRECHVGAETVAGCGHLRSA